METKTPPDVNAGTEPKHFLLSKTFWIAFLGLVVAPWLKRLGVEFTDAETQRAAEALVGLATVAGVVWARAKATQPLHFGLGKGAVLIAWAALCWMLGGCSDKQSEDASVAFVAVASIVCLTVLLVGMGRMLRVVTLAALLPLALGGCAPLAGRVHLQYCRSVGGTAVCADTDGKTVTIKAEGGK